MSSFLHNGDISDPFRSFISKSRYARWIEEYGRRETWEETVDRYVNYIASKVDMSAEDKEALTSAVTNHEVMPSMRAMMTAGEAAERSNVSAYNCSFLAVDHPRAFDEALFILMNGTGLGFSAEKRYVRYLPEVPEAIDPIDEVIVVEDSKEGWAHAYRRLIDHLYAGELPRWDLRQLRPEGARLKTFGGRSSGPAPLNELFEFTVKQFAESRGRRLKPIEVHDIMCMVGSIVVVGGVRRSALISLGSLEDDGHRDAKSGEWWVNNGHRALSNNSAVYHSKPSRKHFDEEWDALVKSGSGERGIFNLAGAKAHVPERRDASKVAGTNPCGEILLRNMGFCNLSEVIIRPEDTLEDLKRKITMAAKIGTWQSTLTNFPYLRPEWRQNAEEERLLGVSLTGQMGHKVLNGSEGKRKLESWLKELRHTAVMANKKEARRLGINQSASVTTVKPSGTVSTLTNTSSGMHAWHDKFYIRRVRSTGMDPIGRFMIDSGVPAEPDVMNPENLVFSFPFKAPEDALVRSDMTAIEQLEMWLSYKTHYTEHNPSVTISVREEEWDDVGDWVFENFDQITGVSFLPHSDHTYQQAPFETIDEAQYEELNASMPDVLDWERLPLYEFEDMTTATSALACTAGECSVVDLITDKEEESTV